MTAALVTTPALTCLHSATSSLRASATIVVFLRRPPFCLTRFSNHKVSWISVVRSLGLAAFEPPWS